MQGQCCVCKESLSCDCIFFCKDCYTERTWPQLIVFLIDDCIRHALHLSE